MADLLVALTGVILQVLGLMVASGSLVLGAVALLMQLGRREPKGNPGRHEDDPGLH